MVHVKERLNAIDFSKLLEDDLIEFKVQLNKDKPLHWLKTVVGFANARGGTLYVGVSDEGHPVGFNRNEYDMLQLHMINLLKNRIDPIVQYDIEYIVVKNKFILKLVVKESKTAVVSYIDRKNDICDVYIRKHGATMKPSMYDLGMLFIQRNPIPYEARISDEHYGDYTFKILNEKYKDMNNTNEDLSYKKLQSLGLVSDDGLLTNAGLLFADQSKNTFPLIHMRKWPGFNKGSDEVIDRKEFRGNLIEQLEMASLFIRNNMKTGFIKLPMGRIDTESYPMRAVIEALCNAIGHRDYLIPGTQVDVDIYQDRMVITSPGDFLPVGQASDYTLDMIPSKRRNEIICNTFATCNLMEKSGSGFEKITDAYKEYDKKFEPKVKSHEDFFMIELKDVLYTEELAAKYTDKIAIDLRLPKNQKIVYEIICNNPGLRVPAISEKCNLTEPSVDNAIRKLKEKSLINYIGSKKDGGYYITS